MNVREEEKQEKKDEFEVTFSPTQCNSVQGKSRVLLRTAEVTIFNPSNPERSLVASVFVDDGSERSFIKANVAKKLGLPVLQTEECHLTGFGEKEAKRYLSNVVRVGFLGVNGDPYICALNEMEFIVKEMPIVTLNSMDEMELRKKKLSLLSRPRQPDILLGMDVRHDLKIRDESEKMPSGFTLSNSRIGRMISGYGQVQCPRDKSAQVMYMGSLISAIQNARRGDNPEDVALPIEGEAEYPKMGRVEKLLRWRDGLVRSVRVQTKGKPLVGAINLLYPLELVQSSEDNVSALQVGAIMDSELATTEPSLPPEKIVQIATTESSLPPVRERSESSRSRRGGRR
ncbi:hypothetical protein niasHT_014796 [Heterodera trifolii]|uniref:Peptidase aspartic putative domain-containing protein n=1 Tax=Heterodera trifolii TaxID=157864 RepID=A0ABD2L8S5_9BILA